MGLEACADLAWYKVLTDLGSFIGGIFALIAGGVAYIAGCMQAQATRQAAMDQIQALTRKDHLQAQCLAVGIAPELLQMQLAHENASSIIEKDFPRLEKEKALTLQIVNTIRRAHIEIPPFLNRVLDELYVLQDAGPTLFQLFSVTMQYNTVVESLAQQIAQNVDGFNSVLHALELSGHLKVIISNVTEAESQIKKLHDEVAQVIL